jgi:hypothetical protein
MVSTFYPRAQVKKTIKAHTNRALSKNVDILIFLSYTLFLQECVCPRRDVRRDAVLTVCRLVKEAAIKSKQAGERGVTAKSVRKVRGDVLRRFKA